MSSTRHVWTCASCAQQCASVPCLMCAVQVSAHLLQLQNCTPAVVHWMHCCTHDMLRWAAGLTHAGTCRSACAPACAASEQLSFFMLYVRCQLQSRTPAIVRAGLTAAPMTSAPQHPIWGSAAAVAAAPCMGCCINAWGQSVLVGARACNLTILMVAGFLCCCCACRSISSRSW